MSDLLASICLSMWMVKSQRIVTSWPFMTGSDWCSYHFSACNKSISDISSNEYTTQSWHVDFCIPSVS